MFDRRNNDMIAQHPPRRAWVGVLPLLLLQAMGVACGNSSSPDPRTGVSMGGVGAATDNVGAGQGGAPANDCSNGSMACAAHATCVPAGTRHQCVCNEGFVGDGAVRCSVLTQPDVCGDKTCQGSESCSTCPADCGACAPVCGDGTCQASESCKTCSDDCGACKPSCGDGTCQANESCTTCPADCGACKPVACAACKVLCLSPASCRVRRCDGVLGCFGSASDSVCDTIAGAACPPVPLFGPCTDSTECGENASCFNGQCTPPACSSQIGGTPCPKLTWPGVTVDCVYSNPCAHTNESCADGASFCQLACTPQAQCPYGLVCSGGYCSPATP
jgi:hypothetical protein